MSKSPIIMNEINSFALLQNLLDRSILINTPTIPNETQETELENCWLSVDNIRKYPGISADIVYRWIDQHNMPAQRMGAPIEIQEKYESHLWVKAVRASDSNNKDSEE